MRTYEVARVASEVMIVAFGVHHVLPAETGNIPGHIVAPKSPLSSWCAEATHRDWSEGCLLR